jgi:homotetrameric cytidine deaminase
MKKAYAPYSKFPVGVAALVDDGRIISGCNVENASYGLGLCAECGLVSNLIASGGGRLVAAVCVDADGNFLSPCGALSSTALRTWWKHFAFHDTRWSSAHVYFAALGFWSG